MRCQINICRNEPMSPNYKTTERHSTSHSGVVAKLGCAPSELEVDESSDALYNDKTEVTANTYGARRPGPQRRPLATCHSSGAYSCRAVHHSLVQQEDIASLHSQPWSTDPRPSTRQRLVNMRSGMQFPVDQQLASNTCGSWATGRIRSKHGQANVNTRELDCRHSNHQLANSRRRPIARR